MSIQKFKDNDLIEAKVIEAFAPKFASLGSDRDDFYNGAFECFAFGDVLYVLKRSPMAGVITQEVFRRSFFAIHDLFTKPGTFEFYMQVFRAIWGENVDVEFTVPAPGILQININVLDVENFDFIAREIVNNSYVHSKILDHDGDNIEFQDTVGIKTQDEINALMHEFCPAGIYNETNLDIL